MTEIASSELILGGQKSGKSRRAEALAQAWLARSPEHRAVLVATGTAHDEEMRARIARHRRDRVAGLRVVEAPVALAEALRACDDSRALVIIDCLTLWLTNLCMPAPGAPSHAVPPAADALLQALRDARARVVLVSNEIGLGVIPLGREVREFVDTLGALNQRVAAQCARVTFMAAGLPMTLKEKESE